VTRLLAEFSLIVPATLLLITLLAACGEQVTNVFSNVVAPGGATASP
jgi:hypothetical protein